MPQPPDFDACRKFYAKGGYAEAPSGKLDRLERELGYVSQHYAAGGGVDLPHLPNSMPQSGPMHYGSDEMAEGGEVPLAAGLGGGRFLRWIENLAGGMTSGEKRAADEVTQYAKNTGKEMMAVGNRFDDPDKFLRSFGNEDSVAFPPGYADVLMNNRDVFTVHPHPTGQPVPSEGDVRGWANNIRSLRSVPNDAVGRQHMWITAPHGASDLSYLEPAKINAVDRYETQLKPDSLMRMRRYMSTPAHTDFRKATQEYAQAALLRPLGIDKDKELEAMNQLAFGYLADRTSEHLPLHLDPKTQLGPDFPGHTTGDVWPDYLKYLEGKGIRPYAEGGPVMTPSDEMGQPSELELAYNSQFFSEGGKVRHHPKSAIETDTIDRLWQLLGNIMGGVR